MTAAPDLPLSGVRVVEIAHDPAERFCGWLYAQSGARVTALSSGATPENASLDGFLNHGKELQHLPRGTSALADYVVPLLDVADVLLADPTFPWEDVPPASRPPISGTVDGFGADGPHAHWQATELVLAAAGGAAAFTRADGRPVFGFGQRFQYLAGQHLFVALSALIGLAPQSGPFPLVRVSAVETVVSLLPYATTQYAYNGTTTTHEQSGPRFLMPCRDGWLCVYAGGRWSDMAALLGDLVDAKDARFVGFADRFAHVEELENLLQRWSRRRTLREATEDARTCSVAVAPVYDLGDLLADPSFDDGRHWAHVTHCGRHGLVPQLPYTFT